jgi:hypothetical protein
VRQLLQAVARCLAVRTLPTLPPTDVRFNSRLGIDAWRGLRSPLLCVLLRVLSLVRGVWCCAGGDAAGPDLGQGAGGQAATRQGLQEGTAGWLVCV